MKEIAFDNDIEMLLGPTIGRKQPPEENENSFGKTLEAAIGEANRLQKEAEQAVQELASGDEKDIHKTMIALEKAEVSFQLMMQVRNKIVAAYEEVMRMQV
ncbi:MAG: flagellar hook-basal body complex protein FliE [Thermodesulfobacteriota bacterium]|nr:flagellar hook-basal body complex protein FliE [Thermodesulfobacteriota bacterium]